MPLYIFVMIDDEGEAVASQLDDTMGDAIVRTETPLIGEPSLAAGHTQDVNAADAVRHCARNALDRART